MQKEIASTDILGNRREELSSFIDKRESFVRSLGRGIIAKSTPEDRERVMDEIVLPLRQRIDGVIRDQFPIQLQRVSKELEAHDQAKAYLDKESRYGRILSQSHLMSQEELATVQADFEKFKKLPEENPQLKSAIANIKEAESESIEANEITPESTTEKSLIYVTTDGKEIDGVRGRLLGLIKSGLGSSNQLINKLYPGVERKVALKKLHRLESRARERLSTTSDALFIDFGTKLNAKGEEIHDNEGWYSVGPKRTSANQVVSEPKDNPAQLASEISEETTIDPKKLDEGVSSGLEIKLYEQGGLIAVPQVTKDVLDIARLGLVGRNPNPQALTLAFGNRDFFDRTMELAAHLPNLIVVDSRRRQVMDSRLEKINQNFSDVIARLSDKDMDEILVNFPMIETRIKEDLNLLQLLGDEKISKIAMSLRILIDDSLVDVNTLTGERYAQVCQDYELYQKIIKTLKAKYAYVPDSKNLASLASSLWGTMRFLKPDGFKEIEDDLEKIKQKERERISKIHQNKLGKSDGNLDPAEPDLEEGIFIEIRISHLENQILVLGNLIQTGVDLPPYIRKSLISFRQELESLQVQRKRKDQRGKPAFTPSESTHAYFD